MTPVDQAPMSINLDVTTACNYRCDHCIDWDILNSKWKHDEDDLRASLAQMAARGMRSVILIGGGEPTVHPRFVEFVKFLKELAFFEDTRHTVDLKTGESLDDVRFRYKLCQAAWAARFEKEKGRRLRVEDDLIRIQKKKVMGVKAPK